MIYEEWSPKKPSFQFAYNYQQEVLIQTKRNDQCNRYQNRFIERQSGHQEKTTATTQFCDHVYRGTTSFQSILQRNLMLVSIQNVRFLREYEVFLSNVSHFSGCPNIEGFESESENLSFFMHSILSNYFVQLC